MSNVQGGSPAFATPNVFSLGWLSMHATKSRTVMYFNPGEFYLATRVGQEDKTGWPTNEANILSTIVPLSTQQSA